MLKALRNQSYQESRDCRIEEYGNMFIKHEMFQISHAKSLKFSDKMSKDMLMHSKLTTESIWVTFHIKSLSHCSMGNHGMGTSEYSNVHTLQQQIWLSLP